MLAPVHSTTPPPPRSALIALTSRRTAVCSRHPYAPITMAAALSSKLSAAALTAAKPAQRAQRAGVVAQAGKTVSGKTVSGKTVSGKAAPKAAAGLSAGQECEWAGRARL